MKTKKRLLSILLSLVMVLGLVPGMSLTALAYDGNPYTDLVNTTNSVKFNNMDWYIIKDESTALNAGSLTLLAKGKVGDSKFGTNNTYKGSTVESYLSTYFTDHFSTVSSAVISVTPSNPEGNNAKLYLLSTDEVSDLDVNVLKDSRMWFLRSPGKNDPNFAYVAYVNYDGTVYGDNSEFWPGNERGVRPALKLDLSKVTFASVNLSGGANATASGASSIINTFYYGTVPQMTSVTYKASEGYMFPETSDLYKETNGITVARTSDTVVTVSGTPTGVANITIPDAMLPKPTVTKAPTAKSLTYTGTAQELVTAGEATGGTMQYAIGTDATTAPTTGYTTSIPTATNAGTYYVWYMAKGNTGYTDSKAECVKATIAEQQPSPSGGGSEPGGSTKIDFVPSTEAASESEGEAPASAQGEGLDELLTEEDKAAGTTYEMTIEPKTFEAVRSNGGEQIQENAREHYASASTGEAKVKEVYLDMSIFKKTGGKSEAVHSTGKAIHVWFPYNLKGRHFPMFWRYHEGTVTPFANSRSGEDGTFYVENEGTENAVVHTFSKEFSTYALTYLEGTVTYSSPEVKKPAESSSSNSGSSYSGSSSSGGTDGPVSVGGVVSGGSLIGGPGSLGRAITETQLPAGMSRKVLYGNGSVLLSVKAADGSGRASANGALLGDSGQILGACLTPEELAAVAAGATAELTLNITDGPAGVTDSVKQAFAAAYPELVFGEFFDITLEKKVGTADRTKVAKTFSALTILLDIRSDLQAPGRSFSVVRDHDGVLTKLADADADATTATIATDSFSTYALAYETAAGTPAAGTKSNGKTAAASPKMDDPVRNAVPLLAVYAIALLAGAVLLKTKKRNG